ncbi:MAG: CPBP family intramembrane glutamic endopeptidase [Sandaracinaceae bacterium]
MAEIAPGLAPDPAEAMAAARRLRIESVRDAFVIPLAFVAIPALAEELFFRGLLLPGLAKQIDPKLAIVVTAVLFGLVHLSPIAILYASLAGVVLGWVRLSTGSVVPAIALHGAFNAMPILLPPEVIRLPGFNTVEPDVYHLPLTLVIGSSLVTFACLAVIARFTDDGEG